MQYRVEYSPEFLRDLDEIWVYIYQEYQNPDAAERITNGIVDTTEILLTFPYSGRVVYLPGGMDSGYRILVFEGYVISYRVFQDVVQVTRAVSSLQDYMRVLFPWIRRSGKDDDDQSS